MERIVVGHYGDPNSLRDLRGITKDEHVVMLEAINHFKKKNELILESSDVQLENDIENMLRSNNLTSFQKSFILDLTPDSYRNILMSEVKLAKKLLEMSIEYSPAITDISNEQYRVLIDCLRYYWKDLDLLINSDTSELKKLIATYDGRYGIDSEKMKHGIEKMCDNEDFIDDFYTKHQLIYRIISEINAPYENEEYVGDNGIVSTEYNFSVKNNFSNDKKNVN